MVLHVNMWGGPGWWCSPPHVSISSVRACLWGLVCVWGGGLNNISLISSKSVGQTVIHTIASISQCRAGQQAKAASPLRARNNSQSSVILLTKLLK